MVDVITTPDPRGPAGGSHRTMAVIVIVVALIFLALFWVMNSGGHNKISDRVSGLPAPTAPATGTASGAQSGGGTSGGATNGGATSGKSPATPGGTQAGTSPSDATSPAAQTSNGQTVTKH